MVLWPAASWISLIVAPAIASQLQYVCLLECQTAPVIFDSFRQGRYHERLSNRAFVFSRGNTRSLARGFLGRIDLIALTASAFRWTVRAYPFLVLVSSIVRRSRFTWDHSVVYCSVSPMPV